MAARETGIGHVEDYMHAGKLLSLDLLVKVLEDKSHNWSHVRTEVFAKPTAYMCRDGSLSLRLSSCASIFWNVRVCRNMHHLLGWSSVLQW